MNLWEIHPLLVHFPIAFLLGGAVLDLVTLGYRRETLSRSAAGLLLAGVCFGWVAAAAGLLAFFTVPAHTEEAHGKMVWHLGLAIASLVLFTWVAIVRWRYRALPPKLLHAMIAVCASVLLVLTGYLGADLVFHGGAGVNPELLSREIREGHSHDQGDRHGNRHSDGSDHQHEGGHH